jgi:Ser/Thr protein kinase RdoA (MazF antagonist)
VSVIPGFEHGAALLAVGPFERLSETHAAELLESRYGIHARFATRLDTERDDSFRVVAAEGEFVLKVAHPAESASEINLQTAALLHAAAADRSLPLQRVIRALDGSLEPTIGDPVRVVRLLNWLPGTPLHELRPSASQLESLGETLGRLSLALRDFSHPAAARDFAWDAANAGSLRPLLEVFPSPEAAEALDRFDDLVAPVMVRLPQQVIHNDFHPGNILVDTSLADTGSPDFVTGIVDFGDVVYTARVVDVSVALSYLLFPGGHSWQELFSFVDGFQSMVPLEQLELDLLPTLVAARFAQRILINQWLDRGVPGNRKDLAAAVIGNTRALAELLN